MSASPQTDKSAGFTGLILGAIALFVMVFAIVRMTNSYYDGKAGHEGAAKTGVEAPK